MGFAAAIAAAQRAARAANGSAITYTRGDDSVDIEKAGRGRTNFNVNNQGILVTVESRDFLIETAALILADEQVLPERGDTITQIDGETTYTYEVLELNGEPAWRYADEYRLQLRVHTKQIESESD